MPDVHTREQRSRNMAAIRHRDTTPERIVRSVVHSMGARFSLQRRDLPGRPDIVLRSRHQVILVHGCFWHCHRCRYGRVRPATNAAFWEAKRSKNVERDRRVRSALRRLGWKVLVVWECQTRDRERLESVLTQFLEPRRAGT